MNPSEQLVIDILAESPQHVSFVLDRLRAEGLSAMDRSHTIVDLILNDKVLLSDDRILSLTGDAS